MQVLDLRSTGQHFQSMWSGASIPRSTSSGRASVPEPRAMTKQHLALLRVFIGLFLKKRILENFITYLLDGRNRDKHPYTYAVKS